jgi:hypothetical protein
VALLTARDPEPDELAEAGELLAVEAVDRTGLVVTSEGALVRVIAVTPPNPLVLSAEERGQTAEAFCPLVSRLRAGQSLQFCVQARTLGLVEGEGRAGDLAVHR